MLITQADTQDTDKITSFEAKCPPFSAVSEHAEDAIVPLEAIEEPYTPSIDDEKKLRRKLDLTILPWIMMMYFLSYMDRLALPDILKRPSTHIIVGATSEMRERLAWSTTCT